MHFGALGGGGDLTTLLWESVGSVGMFGDAGVSR